MNNFEKIKAMNIDEMAKFIKKLKTNILQAMKLKIGNELFERILKRERNNENS